MQGSLVAILRLLLEAIGDVKYVGPTEPLTNYISDEAALAAIMEALPASSSDPSADSREKRIRNYLGIVRGRYDLADSAGLLDMLRRVRGVLAGTIRHVEGLPNGIKYLEDNLLLDVRTGHAQTNDGMDLLTGVLQPADFTLSGTSATKAIVSLRQVDDVLIRVLGTEAAADALGQPIAEVMAMYRVEGDLAAPVSKQSMDDKIPPAKTTADTSLNPRPAIGSLVMMYRDGADPSFPAGDGWRTHMLLAWMVHIGGLDVYGKQPTRGAFATLSSDIRREIGAPNDSVSDALARWDAARANIEQWSVVSPEETVIIGVPADPVALVSFVLQEAITYQLHLKAFGSFTLDANLSYLRYNVEDTFEAYLVRAATVVAKSNLGGRYAALRSEILSDSAFADAMKELDRIVEPMRRTDPAIEKLMPEWPRVLGWLHRAPASAGNNRFELLVDFLQNATAREWRSFQGPRGNLSRYRVLRDYYSRVFN